MDDELVTGSTGPAGASPAGPNLHDWNTSLASPEPDAAGLSAGGLSADGLGAGGLGAGGATDTGSSGRSAANRGEAQARPGVLPKAKPGPQPQWRDPAELPGVARAHTGVFGQKLQALEEAATSVRAVMASLDVNALDDAELVALTQVVERTGRPVDAARVSAATVVGFRSRRMLGRESLAWRLGASHHTDLLARLTGASVPEMKRRLQLGEKTCPRVMGGQVLEPEFPFVAAALTTGEIGIDAAENIVAGLADYKVHGRFDADQAHVDAGEAALVENATGSRYARTPNPETAADAGVVGSGPVRRVGEADGFTFPADRIREMALAWQARLNPDGIAPTEPTLEPKSTVSFGTLKDGLHPLRGGVTSELKGVMQNLFNTFQSARTTPRFPSADDQQRIEAGELVPGDQLDDRTGGQKRADILRGILVHVAQDPRTPTMGGMPPTVMVHVNATDLLAQAGVGWIDGIDGPVSMTTINQMIDNGGFQPVFLGTTGNILGLGSVARCFTPLQRKAITARDGGCIIPGCECPPQWTEVHHVTPWHQGGTTHVDNGVLLCWYHHHTITSSTGWKIRMVRGKPHVKAPHWIDPTDTWRHPTPHRAHDPNTRE